MNNSKIAAEHFEKVVQCYCRKIAKEDLNLPISEEFPNGMEDILATYVHFPQVSSFTDLTHARMSLLEALCVLLSNLRSGAVLPQKMVESFFISARVAIGPCPEGKKVCEPLAEATKSIGKISTKDVN